MAWLAVGDNATGVMLMRSVLAPAIALLIAAIGPAGAHAQRFRVVVVENLGLADLERLEPRAAVGLLVPAAGPTASETAALASLRRGEVRNSLRGGLPAGRPLIRVERAAAPPSRGAVIVLALPEGGPAPNQRRYPIAIIGGGYRGLLQSRTARIAGLVSIGDVAPTALGRRGSMLGWTGQRDAAEAVTALDRRIRSDGRARVAASVLLLVLGLGLALASPRAALLAFPTTLTANLVLGVAGAAPATAAVGFALALVAALPLSRVLRRPLVLGLALAAALPAYLIALALDPSIVALSPLGPTQNSRFYGLSNLLATMLLVPALAAARLLYERLGWAAFALVALLALVTVTSSHLGTDGGGALVLAAGYSVLALLLVRRRRLATFTGVAAIMLLATLAIVRVDAATGASSNITRALAGGPVHLGRSLADRVVLSYGHATSHWYVALLVGAASFSLGLLAARRLRRRPLGGDDALPLAFAAAVAVSLVVNDSPLEVALAGLLGYLSLRAPLLAVPAEARAGAPRELRSPGRPA